MKGGDVMQTAKLPATGHKVKFSRYFERNRALYLMLIPGLILLVLFRYLPIYSFCYSASRRQAVIPQMSAPLFLRLRRSNSLHPR